MKRLFTFATLALFFLLSACDKSDVRPEELSNITTIDTKAKRIDRVEFRIGTEPFEFVNLDTALDNNDELRGNQIRLQSKGFDKTPYLSIATEDVRDILRWIVAGAGDKYEFNLGQYDEHTRRGFKLISNADQSQNLFMGWYQAGNSPWFFKEGQLICMYFNGDASGTRQIFNKANEGICLVKDNQLNKREIPLMTDLKRVVLSQKDNNGGGQPNTANISANFKPRGALLAISLENEADFDIEIKGIKFLRPQALAYKGYFDIVHDIIHNENANSPYKGESHKVPFRASETNQDNEFPFYSEPDSQSFLRLSSGQRTDGRFYVWGYPIERRETEPIIAQIKYTKVGDSSNKEYYSITQKIDPRGKQWTSGKAYRCNFKIKHAFEYDEIFADEMRTQLVRGITEEAINKMPEGAWKEVAKKMNSDTYEREFRIRDYKLFLHPHAQKDINKTNPWSILDNPTGIEVQAGETLEVMCGELNGFTDVKLRVLDFMPGGTGFSPAPSETYMLQKGLNKFHIRKKGLVYLEYMTGNWADLGVKPPLKLHFANGKASGFFDSQDPDMQGREDDILRNTTAECFDLVGQYAHLTFPTEEFRNATHNLEALIDDYDKIIRSEMEFLGLFRYKKVYKNRLYLNVGWSGNMAATWYHVGSNNSNSPQILNEDWINNQNSFNLWAPAHEVGHMSQTQGFDWFGLAEVSNNVLSMYVSATIFGQLPRIYREGLRTVKHHMDRNNGSGEDIDIWFNNRYTSAFNQILVDQVSYAQAQNAERFVPLWQLQLYFGEVLGLSPHKQVDKGGFYPDLYEYLRTHPRTPATLGCNQHGADQTEFAYIASEVSGYNLIPFFEKWGFLKAFNGECIDNDRGYTRAEFIVTQERVEEIKQRIQGIRGLKTISAPIEYISDHNVELFKHNTHVVEGGNASWSGVDLNIPNWQNVVVYEIWDKPCEEEGARLIYAGDGYDAEHPDSTTAKLSVVKHFIGNDTPVHLYAVDVDNSRIPITIN